MCKNYKDFLKKELLFPRNIEIDIDNVPEDFDAQIRQAFSDYTEGTNENYTYQDKLCFIDVCRKLLHRSEDTHDCVMELLKGRFMYGIEECCNFPSESDFMNIEFMELCFDAGRTNLYSHYTGDHHKDEKIMKLLVRVIKTVIEYSPEEVK